MNIVTLIGRLAADPEMKYTQNGNQVINFTLAVERKFKNSEGELDVDWIRCVAWRKTAELIDQYCSKGHKIAAEGSWQTRKYQDKDGNNRNANECLVDSIEFLDRGKDSDNNGNTSDGDYQDGSYDNHSSSYDEMPF